MTCTHSLHSDGDEGPDVTLPGLHVVRWRCTECGGRWYDDESLLDLRDLIRRRTEALNAAEAERDELRALVNAKQSWIDGAKVDAEAAEAEVAHLQAALAESREAHAHWYDEATRLQAALARIFRAVVTAHYEVEVEAASTLWRDTLPTDVTVSRIERADTTEEADR